MTLCLNTFDGYDLQTSFKSEVFKFYSLFTFDSSLNVRYLIICKSGLESVAGVQVIEGCREKATDATLKN